MIVLVEGNTKDVDSSSNYSMINCMRVIILVVVNIVALIERSVVIMIIMLVIIM